MGTSMASPYKSLLIFWKHFFGYLVYEIFLWPESWGGSLHIYLLSFPRFWSLSIGRFWFWFWSILNGVTLKTGHRCIWTLFAEVFTNMIYWKKAYFSLSTKHVRLLYSHNILFCHLKTAFFSSDILAKSNTCWQDWLILIVCFTASERSKYSHANLVYVSSSFCHC